VERKKTGVAQRYERFAFNKVVEGSIPSTGIMEWDTAHGAKNQNKRGFSNATAFLVRILRLAPLF